MKPEWVAVVIAAIGAAGAVLAAWLSGRNNRKLEDIHQLVNANLRRVEKALEVALRRIRELENKSRR